MQPLSASGHDVDIVTGLPVEREVLDKRNLRKIVEESQTLINELSGDGGVVVKEAIKLFVERVNTLISADPECQAYERLFSTISYSVNVGKGVVEDRAKFLANL